MTPTFITNTKYITGTKEYQTEDSNMELFWGQGIKVNNINLINGKHTDYMNNDMICTSVNNSLIYSNIRQTHEVITTQNANTNMPSPKRTYTSTQSQEIVQYSKPNIQEDTISNIQTYNNYDLHIKRLIRKYDRHYTKQKTLTNYNEHQDSILDYNTNISQIDYSITSLQGH
jgi:hypothetical protein